MSKGKPLLVYRFVSKSRSVEISVVNNDSELTPDSIDANKISYSFEELYAQITDFRNDYSEFSKYIEATADSLPHAKAPYKAKLEGLLSNWLNNNNIFTQYYSIALFGFFELYRDRVNTNNPLRHFGSSIKSKREANHILDRIQKNMFKNWDSLFDITASPLIKTVECDKLYIRDCDKNYSMFIADSALENFICDFAFELQKLKLMSIKCSYCYESFLGTKGEIACSKATCQEAYKKDIKRLMRKKSESDPLNKYLIRFSNFMGQVKLRLPEMVLSNQALVTEWDIKRKFFTSKLRDKIEEYRIEQRTPDNELDKYYNELFNEVKTFVKYLVDKAEKQTE